MKNKLGISIFILSLLALFLFFILIFYDNGELYSNQNGSVTPQDAFPSVSEPVITGSAIGEIIAVEEEVLRPTFKISFKYNKYMTTFTYLFADKQSVDIHSGPSSKDPILHSITWGKRLNYLETVWIRAEGDSQEKWYHIFWVEDGSLRFGFVNSDNVVMRYFQFDKMEEAIKKAEQYFEKGRLTYINNYQNLKGYAPLYKGGTKDKEGNSRSQSAPGYYNPDLKGDFRYIGDGTLVRCLYTADGYAKIQVVDTDEYFYIPKKYLPIGQELTGLKKVIAIDRSNENEVVFEKTDGGWKIVSCTFATTGTTGPYSQPTPLGFFYIIEKRDQFLYYKDGTREIQGYAPYALRFAGGAYVHGIPVNYRYGEDGTRITPPHQEYSDTIGTIPLSHKCVRNYTSHARFLYDWAELGETIVIVIEKN